MRTGKYSPEQIARALRHAESGTPIALRRSYAKAAQSGLTLQCLHPEPLGLALVGGKLSTIDSELTAPTRRGPISGQRGGESPLPIELTCA